MDVVGFHIRLLVNLQVIKDIVHWPFTSEQPLEYCGMWLSDGLLPNMKAYPPRLLRTLAMPSMVVLTITSSVWEDMYSYIRWYVGNWFVETSILYEKRSVDHKKNWMLRLLTKFVLCLLHSFRKILSLYTCDCLKKSNVAPPTTAPYSILVCLDNSSAVLAAVDCKRISKEK